MSNRERPPLRRRLLPFAVISLSLLVVTPVVQLMVADRQWRHATNALLDYAYVFPGMDGSPAGFYRALEELAEFGVGFSDIHAYRRGSNIVIECNGRKTIYLLGIWPVRKSYELRSERPLF